MIILYIMLHNKISIDAYSRFYCVTVGLRSSKNESVHYVRE